jgi:dGTPase
MLSAQVYDVIAATQTALEAAHPADVAAVRQLPPLVQFGADMRAKSHALKAFLLQQLYRHPQVMHTNGQARQVVRELFEAYFSAPAEMPDRYQRRAALGAGLEPAHRTARAVADYIAGMTDRFAAREHERLTGARLLA